MECIQIYLMNMEENVVAEPDASLLNEADKWILSRVNTLAKDVTENMDKFELGIAVQKVYDFIWDEFCDWYVETAKYRIYHKEEETEGCRLCTLDIEDRARTGVEAASSVYAVCDRRDLQRTGAGRRISDDVRAGHVS